MTGLPLFVVMLKLLILRFRRIYIKKYYRTGDNRLFFNTSMQEN